MTAPTLPLGTLPLTPHGYAALERVAKNPVPKFLTNSGIVSRLLREALAEWVDLPNPSQEARAERPLYPHLQITEAGLQVLATRQKEAS